MFSPCSRSSIGAVLLAKGNCFQGDPVSCHMTTTRWLTYSQEPFLFWTVMWLLLLSCDNSAARSTVCGDYRIDEGEDCDAGPDGDTCCTVTCELTANSNCRYVSLCHWPPPPPPSPPPPPPPSPPFLMLLICTIFTNLISFRHSEIQKLPLHSSQSQCLK